MRISKFVNVALPFVLTGAVFMAACGSQNQYAETPAAAPASATSAEVKPVVVELFTSEGCSSCPPADKQLEFLARQQPVTNADIIALAFHVDYWDNASWRDPFSSPLFTQRQELYVRQLKLDSAYTPQMVVGGTINLVGSDGNRALTAVMESVRAASGTVKSAIEGEKVKLDISDLPKHGAATVYIAATEDNLKSNVSGGENAGSKFVHTSVVRELKPVATISGTDSAFSVAAELPFSQSWKRADVRYVAIVQDNTDRKIIAAGRIAR